MNRFIFRTTIFFRTLVRLIPASLKIWLVKGIAKLFFALDKKHREIVLKNLNFFLGDRYSPKEIDAIARACFYRYGRYVVDFVENPDRSKAALSSLVTPVNDEPLKALLEKNQKVISITGHFGNWELIGQYISTHYRPVTGIGHKLHNSALLTLELDRYRRQFGIEILPRRGAVRGVAKAIKSGRLPGLLLDQAVKEGVKVKFFGRELTWIDTAARLAKQFDAAIVPAFITTDDFSRYTITFDNPVFPDPALDRETDVARLAQAEASALEAAILKNPEEYFWFHKRLKHDYPGFYSG